MIEISTKIGSGFVVSKQESVWIEFMHCRKSNIEVLMVTNDPTNDLHVVFSRENRTEQRETQPLVSISIEVGGNGPKNMIFENKHRRK